MDSIYLFIVILLSLLAIGDLIVGVSNDAVNFLNSAIGSKVFSFRKIMIFASVGILFGALSSSGMMEVARKGIFNPGAFFFDEIIFIFMAVMMTDILLLDFFNTIGLPTSTTVSIVFELLGAAVVMAIIKIAKSDQLLSDLSTYINTEKATQIILGILLSVFIAFSIGALVQWISRIIYTFNFEKKPSWLNSLFGGVALAAIFNFILIKGIKGTPYSNMELELLNSQTINSFIESNLLSVQIISFILWFFFSVLMNFIKWDIYKIIIGVGTFALALAFAGNDLVNFIGVPIAAFQSYKAWLGSGVSAESFSMIQLTQKVQTPTIFLFVSGTIMIITLWFSSKAKKVVKTSLDLSNQYGTRERFKPNFLSRILVRIFINLNEIIKNAIPEKTQLVLNNSFKQINPKGNINASNIPEFDKLRASINLVVASVLISFATSLKLPLSTTYVTFMVTMGTSLADRAWSSDSAVYRVSGVLNVIGGWFLTAFSAFTVGGIIVYLLNIGGVQVIAVIMFIILLIIGKNYVNHRKENKSVREEEIALIVESNSFQGVIDQSGSTIELVLKKSYKVYKLIILGLSTNDLEPLEKAKKNSKKLQNSIEDLKGNLFYFIRNLEKSSLPASTFYIELLGYLHDLSEDLTYLAKISYDHLNNNHRKLTFSQIKDLLLIEESVNKIFKEGKEAFNSIQNQKEFEEVLFEKNNSFGLIESKINTQIERTRSEETSPKNTTLYFNFLIRTKDLITHKYELVEKYYGVVKKL
ncbi:phosphate:sodium symporter [Bacteroidetes bacterium SCGC AAA795-G10]|nr:phosphate:sodium symporter [Bacteroidetes bacterium SCGC AAA795-G10]